MLHFSCYEMAFPAVQLKPLLEQAPSSGGLETGKKDFGYKKRLFPRRTVHGTVALLHRYRNKEPRM